MPALVVVVCLGLLAAACGGGGSALALPRTVTGVDAHDGHLLQVGSTYYLYGTSYDCGFRLSDPASPWCGFRTYTSTDLVHWTDRGPTFDPAPWQSRCGRGSFGCFRVDVVRNPTTKRYVLWFNDAGSSAGYQVMTSSSPLGPWSPSPEPELAVKAGDYGDEALLADGPHAWIAYTVIDGMHHDIAFQALDGAWTSGAGVATTLGESLVEAPALFAADGHFYLTYSDPACPYCSGTGTSSRTAPTALGPWSPSTLLSATSCGGQPAFVEEIDRGGRSLYVYSSDLWDHGDFNEARARIYLAVLGVTPTGARPLDCAGSDPPPAT